MKRVVLIALLVASVFTAQAWTKLMNNAANVLAKKYMTESVLAEYNRIVALGKSVEGEVKVADYATSKVLLDAELNSTTTSEQDIVVMLERAAEVLRNRANHTDLEVVTAMTTIEKLMPELHDLSRIAIEGVAASHKDFNIHYVTGQGSKKEKRNTITWSRFWGRHFCGWHQGWSSEYFAYDMEVVYGAEREKLSAGTIRDWAHEMGERALPLYKNFYPECEIENSYRLILEDTHLGSVARAGYRLAVLLNDVIK